MNYDEKNWLLLSKALKSDFTKIPTLNRVQLLADSADLGYVGHRKYDVFFDMLGYLKKETEYLPWKAALGKADALKNYLIRNPIYGVFKVNVRFYPMKINKPVSHFRITLPHC